MRKAYYLCDTAGGDEVMHGAHMRTPSVHAWDEPPLHNAAILIPIRAVFLGASFKQCQSDRSR